MDRLPKKPPRKPVDKHKAAIRGMDGADASFTVFGAVCAVLVLLGVFVLGLRAGNLQVCMEAKQYRGDMALDSCGSIF